MQPAPISRSMVVCIWADAFQPSFKKPAQAGFFLPLNARQATEQLSGLTYVPCGAGF